MEFTRPWPPVFVPHDHSIVCPLYRGPEPGQSPASCTQVKVFLCWDSIAGPLCMEVTWPRPPVQFSA